MITILNSAAALMFKRPQNPPPAPPKPEIEQPAPRKEREFYGKRLEIVLPSQNQTFRNAIQVGKAIMACRSWDHEIAALQHDTNPKPYRAKSVSVYTGNLDRTTLEHWFGVVEEDFGYSSLNSPEFADTIGFAGKDLMEMFSPPDDQDEFMGRYLTRAVWFERGRMGCFLFGPIEMPPKDIVVVHPKLCDRLMRTLEKYPAPEEEGVQP